MKKSYTFNNVTVTLDEGDTYEVMYYHKGFLYLNMGGERTSFVPIHADNLLPVLQDPLNEVVDYIPIRIIEILEEMIQGHELDFAAADGLIYRFDQMN